MQDLRTTIAKNISELRKSQSLTQIQFAEKLNYSDKAVSKWERGESIPDVIVLKQIADLFSVSVDYLLQEEHKSPTPTKKRRIIKNRALISVGSVVSVWLIATLIFVSLDFFTGIDWTEKWKVFLFALPVSAIVALVFNSVWGKKKNNYIIISVLMWSVLVCIYFAFLSYNPWLIFIVGVPAQIVILIFSAIRKG